MKNKLLYKMLALIAVGTVILFWSIDMLNRQAELQMSFIAPEYQQEIIAYATETERLFLTEDEQRLSDWLQHIQVKEDTWVALVQSSIITLANTSISKRFMDEHRLGRSLSWKIHLYFKQNPVMEVTFADKHTRFLILLPDRMRPGGYYPAIQILLQIALPLFILSLLSWMLYRHVMKPLRALKNATLQFGEGDYDIQVKASLGKRKDELTTLADSFDQMASRTGKIITSQRQLLENLSHELRTPLARLDMALECVKQGIHTNASIDRLSSESVIMRELVEDTLMLVWLNNETPELNNDDFDLSELLDVICSDARFEFPNHHIILNQPEQLFIKSSSQRALAQALENIIRNALQHTPEKNKVTVSAFSENDNFLIIVEDAGPGVPEQLLQNIFLPFFQVDKSRCRKSSVIPLATGVRRGGFGLGLALAERQIVAAGGSIKAENLKSLNSDKAIGLKMTIVLNRFIGAM